MQYLLIAVAIGSAAVAVVMCVLVVRMLREDRRRSDARVEALLAMADSSGEELPSGRAMPIEREADPVVQTSYRAARSPEPDRDDLVLDSDRHVAGVEGLFAAPETSSPWGRRIGVGAAGMALLVIAVLASGGRGGDRSDQDGNVPQGSAQIPLELLSLTHAAEPKALTITGLVQNPRGGPALANVTAVALLFSADGGFVASGRAPLDFTRLDPGSESPFVVKVPTTARVARYRVSFRGPDGAVIAHVDRRSAAPLARKEQTGAP
jgi:hypothetical protein